MLEMIDKYVPAQRTMFLLHIIRMYGKKPLFVILCGCRVITNQGPGFYALYVLIEWFGMV